MSIAIPTTPAELAEILSDDAKRTEVFANADTSKQFLENYSKATDRKGEVTAQIVNETVAGVVDFLKENGAVKGRPDQAYNLAKEINKELSLKRGSGASINAAYNPSAPGAAVQGLDFHGMGDFLRTTSPSNLQTMKLNGDKLSKLREINNAYSSLDPSSAGFLIPEDVRSNIMQVALETGVVRPRATVITMSTRSTEIPFVDMTTHVGSVFGGMVFYWTPEAGELVESQAKFGRIKLEANKITGYAVVPNELYNDAPALGTWFNQAAPGGLAFYEDVAFFDGDGANEPLGFLNSGAMVTVTKETNQPADTIVWDNIVKMYAQMLPTSLGSAVWLVNQTALPQLLSMAIAVGTGGAPVMTANAAVTPQMTLLGRPIIVTEKCAAIGDLNDIVFADLSYYLVGDRQAISVESSPHVKFSSDQTAIRLIARVDGRPWIQSAITPLNGTAVSPFVNLEAR